MKKNETRNSIFLRDISNSNLLSKAPEVNQMDSLYPQSEDQNYIESIEGEFYETKQKNVNIISLLTSQNLTKDTKVVLDAYSSIKSSNYGYLNTQKHEQKLRDKLRRAKNDSTIFYSYLTIRIIYIMSWIIIVIAGLHFGSIRQNTQTDQQFSVEILHSSLRLNLGTLYNPYKLNLCYLSHEGILPDDLLSKVGVPNPAKSCFNTFIFSWAIIDFLEVYSSSILKLSFQDDSLKNIVNGKKAIPMNGYSEFYGTFGKNTHPLDGKYSSTLANMREAAIFISASCQLFRNRDYVNFTNVPAMFPDIEQPFHRENDPEVDLLMSNLQGPIVGHLTDSHTLIVRYLQAVGNLNMTICYLDSLKVIIMTVVVLTSLFVILAYYIRKYSHLYHHILQIKVSFS